MRPSKWKRTVLKHETAPTMTTVTSPSSLSLSRLLPLLLPATIVIIVIIATFVITVAFVTTVIFVITV
jgi:hypothetical protein